MLYSSENIHGGDIYGKSIKLDYSVNINPFGTPEEVYKAAEEAIRRVQNYPDPYCRALVNSIAGYEELPEKYILCGNGAAELIYNYCRAAGIKSAALMEPSFTEYELGLKAAGLGDEQLLKFYLRADKGFLPDEGFLDFIKDNKPDAVFLCNPNNPTGRCLSKEMTEKIVGCCRENKIKIFADECFLELSDSSVSMKQYLDAYSGLFILKAFTKNFGMAGLRLGYCLSADEELLGRMAELSQPWNVSVPAQAAGQAAMNCRYFIDKAREIIPEERKYLTRELTKRGFEVVPSEANFILFSGPEGLDKRLLEYGISIRNCSNFSGLQEGWFRIAVKLHEENEILIDALGRLMN